jgi:hypothetical protein
MDLIEIGLVGLDWNGLAQGRYKRRTLVTDCVNELSGSIEYRKIIE